MANPTFIDIPEGEWTKVIDANTSGIITLIETNPNKILYARKDTGETAPTLTSEGTPIFIGSIREEFSAKQLSDAYLWPIGGSSRVEVDV